VINFNFSNGRLASGWHSLLTTWCTTSNWCSVGGSAA
jgi:hypothetical protein